MTNWCEIYNHYFYQLLFDLLFILNFQCPLSPHSEFRCKISNYLTCSFLLFCLVIGSSSIIQYHFILLISHIILLAFPQSTYRLLHSLIQMLISLFEIAIRVLNYLVDYIGTHLDRFMNSEIPTKSMIFQHYLKSLLLFICWCSSKKVSNSCILLILISTFRSRSCRLSSGHLTSLQSISPALCLIRYLHFSILGFQTIFNIALARLHNFHQHIIFIPQLCYFCLKLWD